MVRFLRVIGRAEAVDSEGRWVPGWPRGFLSRKGRDAVLRCWQGWTQPGSGSHWLVCVCFSKEAWWTDVDGLGKSSCDQKSAFVKKWETKHKNPNPSSCCCSQVPSSQRVITSLARVRLVVKRPYSITCHVTVFTRFMSISGKIFLNVTSVNTHDPAKIMSVLNIWRPRSTNIYGFLLLDTTLNNEESKLLLITEAGKGSL